MNSGLGNKKLEKIQASKAQNQPKHTGTQIAKNNKDIKDLGLVDQIADKTPKFRPNHVIVKYKNGIGLTPVMAPVLTPGGAVNQIGLIKPDLGIDALEKSVGAETVRTFRSGAKLLKLPQQSSVQAIIDTLKKSPLVEYAEPDYKISIATHYPNDPYFSSEWGMDNWSYAQNDINGPEAWDISKGSSDVVVAVIDTGVDFSHSDLAAAAWVNPGEIAGNGIDDDMNGYVDDINGWDFVDNDASVYSIDNNWHGTHVAGTIAAQMDDSYGVAGVAPNVKLMALRCFDNSGYGYTSDAVYAVDYAAAKGVKISNNSWGGGDYSQALYDSIANSNSLFVAAAGNQYRNNNDFWGFYPSSYNLNNILSVAAFGYDGYLADFSNFGPTTVDVAAPGVDIYSDYPGNSFAYASGTSMATPHATGTAALVLSENPSFSPTEVKQRIMDTCSPNPHLLGMTVTDGNVNAFRALSNPDDDIPGVAYPVASGASYADSLDSASDMDDVFRVSLTPGETITANMTGPAGADFDLYLFNPWAQSVVDMSNCVVASEGSGSTESFSYTVPEQQAGVYYIDAYAYGGSGPYTLSVNWGNSAGIYDDKEQANVLHFNGNWTQVNDASAYKGTYSSSTAKYDSIGLDFRGNVIEWYATKAPNMGKARVYIDGQSIPQDFSLYSATPQYKQKIFYNVLPPGEHNIRIECLAQPGGGKKTAIGVNLDYFQVSNIPVGKVGLTEETSDTVYYANNSWSSHSNANHSGGTVKYSDADSAAAVFSFYGNSIEWWAYKSASYGIANVYIDGAFNSTVDLYASSAQYKQKVFTLSGLVSGWHRIRIERSGTKNPSATSTRINVDAFFVGDNSAPPTPANLVSSYNGSGVALTWDAGIASAVDHYAIFRSSDYGSTYGQIGTSTSTSYTDSTVAARNIYFYKVEAVSAGGEYSGDSNIAQVASAEVSTHGLIENSFSSVYYNPSSWTLSTNKYNSGGTMCYSTTSGSYAEFFFKGTGIEWWAYKNKPYGIINVYIDDVLQTPVDLYSETAQYKQVVYTNSSLSEGIHKIRIERSGTKNPLATGFAVNLDAFNVI